MHTSDRQFGPMPENTRPYQIEYGWRIRFAL